MLWVYNNVGGNIKIRFGYDAFVPALNGAGNAKIGHVALVNTAIISGEIFPDGHGGWKIDNNSGAWGAMSNQNGKSTMMDTVALMMSQAGNMQVNARKAYSRRTWKRTIQQLYR
jgi:hypothetical protein